MERVLRAALLHCAAPEAADRLCAAAAVLAELDGVVLSAVHDGGGLVPVGASGPLASAAEHAEATAGEGPVQHADLSGQPGLLADTTDPEDGGRRQWPLWAVLLARHTPYRSVISVPVPTSLAPAHGQRPLPPVPLVLSCYRRTPLATPSTPIGQAMADVGAALAAAQELATALDAVLGRVVAALGGGPPPWLDSERALRRAQVRRAEELLVRSDPLLHREEALTALRTCAVVHGVLLEEVAARLLGGQLTAAAVRGQSP